MSRFARNRNLITFAATAAATILAMSHLAAAETQTFQKPMHPQGNRLDWCLNWAQGCGKDAADAFCKQKGFKSAQSFTKATDIGDKVKTRVLATGAVCDQKLCDGFGAITCVKPSNVVFDKPMHPQGSRLDWCVSWAQNCGKPAADAFCKAKGHAAGAVSFTKATDIGDKIKTRLIGTGAVCDQKMCDGFGQIVCHP
jgi:hypothetical protein